MTQKVLIAFAVLCAVAAYARPRYVVVPIEYAQQFYYPGVYPQYQVPQVRQARQVYNYRFSRQAENEPRLRGNENRRQSPVEAEEGLPAFSIPAAIRQSEDAIAAGSSPATYGSQGPDYVDYGAYTGGYGAFGWYSDHPVLVH